MLKKFALLLAPLILVGCGGGGGDAAETQTTGLEPSENAEAVNTDGFPIVDEKITLTMVGPQVGRGQWHERPYFQEMEELTNIAFEFNTPPRDDFGTNKQLLLASGDLPDIFYAADLTLQEQMEYGGNGFLVPLEGLIEEYAPNIQAMLDERPEVEKAITTPDGHIYALPSVSEQPSFWRMWYNGDWLEALGVEELPKTTDELYELLVRFKNEDPNGNGIADEIPISNHEGVSEFDDYLMMAFGVRGMGMGLYGDNYDEVGYGPIAPGYREYLEYMNRLWEEDLFDHESFSQTNPQKQAKGAQNLVGVFADASPVFMLGADPQDTSHPVFHPITSDLIDEPIVFESTGIGSGTFAITKDNEHPEASIRWVDYSYTPEGEDLLHNGPEGDYWSWQDEEEGIRVINEAPEGYDSPEDYRSSISPDWGIGVPVRRFTAEDHGWRFDNPYEEWLRNEEETKLVPYEVPRYPNVYFSDEDLREIERIERDLHTYVDRARAEFITGDRPLTDEEWDDYMQTIEDMNIDRLLEIYQEGFDQYQSN